MTAVTHYKLFQSINLQIKPQLKFKSMGMLKWVDSNKKSSVSDTKGQNIDQIIGCDCKFYGTEAVKNSSPDCSFMKIQDRPWT